MKNKNKKTIGDRTAAILKSKPTIKRIGLTFTRMGRAFRRK